MKYLRLILLVPPIMMLLAGCGGGGSTGTSASRKASVVFHIDWPSRAAAKSRVVPFGTQSVLIEAFVGKDRVQAAVVTFGTDPDPFSIPVGPTTFFITGFSAAAGAIDPGIYKTDFGTGALFNNNVALTSTELNVPLARGVTTVTVTDTDPPTKVDVTLNNTIATLVPVDLANSHIAIGATVDLNTMIQAKDSNGAVVLPRPTELQWEYDTTDSLAGNHLAFVAATPPADPTVHKVTATATGSARLIVKDTAVNNAGTGSNLNQVPIQAVVGFTIDAATSVTVAMDATRLRDTTPLYAKSVRFTLTEEKLAPGDIPAPAVVIPYDVTGFNLSANTVTLPAVTLPYVESGRKFTLTIDALSNTGGQGVVIASTSSALLRLSDLTANTYNQPIFPAGDYKISGFVAAVLPTNIYFLNAGQSGPGLTNTAQTTVTLAVGGVNTNQAINPGTVVLSVAPATAASIANATGIVTAKAVGAATAVTVTAHDSKNTAGIADGTATVTVNPVQGSAGLGIK